MTEFTEEELKHLGSVFKELKIKPKADTAADFKQWMTAYVAQMNKDDNSTVKTEPGTDTATQKITTTHHIPKVSCFSGDGSKQDTTYDLWRYEIDCLFREKYSEASIAQAIRRSLRGDAGKSCYALRTGSNCLPNTRKDGKRIRNSRTRRNNYAGILQRDTRKK
ncbi:hypothetical protein FSP39_021322 [Pinctada imbricata]|uniref:Uncharacterized protein n=1 Tax=Pinctada imbricata TaxID=66713 RepID=A0AA88YK42_PINIB|nr:hypothetical protein FSP39_021322 [Pinctada imbricata]